MKVILILCALFFSNNYAKAESGVGKIFAAVSENGFSGTCATVENSDNDLIRESHLKYILMTQKKAKEECEVETGKLCGVVQWGSKNITTSSGSRGCFAVATSKAF